MTNKKALDQYLKVIKESENNQECPVKYTLEVIGGRWKMRILYNY